MQVTTDIHSTKQYCRKKKFEHKKIGLVPTMGALHAGHLSLIKSARASCDFLVVSIFINPAQFGPAEDLEKYPRDLTADLKLCQEQAVDIVFVPSAKEVYPEDFSTWVEVTGGFTEILEGVSRPNHFRGVATVVAKLFNIILPDFSYFGEKDYQQALIIKKMVQDLDMDTQIVSMPTVREKDGLACSSRNIYLKPEERKAATVLYKSLLAAKTVVRNGEKDSSSVRACMEELIAREVLAEIDYIAIVDAENLQKLEQIQGRALIALAVKIGKTRLIDNVLV